MQLKNSNYLRGALLVSLGIVLVGGLVFIYSKSHTFSAADQVEIRRDLRTLESLDSQWGLDIWKAKDSYETSYKEGGSPLEKIVALKSELDEDFSKMNNKNLLNMSLKINDIIDEKKEVIKSFNAQIFLLKNSLSYISTESAALDKNIWSDLIEKKSDKKAQREILALDGLNKRLLSESLKFSVSKSEKSKSDLLSILKDLRKAQDDSLGGSSNAFSHALFDQIDIVAMHAETIVEQIDAERILMAKISRLNLRDHTNALDELLASEYSAQIAIQSNYQKLLFAYAFFLVLMVVYAGFRVFKSLTEVRLANSSLETKVQERTKDAVDALALLKESQVQLIQAEKMSSVGQMVAGVSHEINTPIGYVKGNLQTIQSRLPYLNELVDEVPKLIALTRSNPDPLVRNQCTIVEYAASQIIENEIMPELKDITSDSLDGILKISEIVIGLKNFSRIDRAQNTEFDVHEGIESTLKIATNVVRNKQIVKNFNKGIHHVFCAPSSINQVLLNLISNAAQATGDDGVITISTFESDSNVCISIADNGTGMSQTVMSKIFEPFYTTKPVGEGTGLGLSICQKIIQDHKGTLTVESKEGAWTKFTIELPIKG